VPTMTRLAARLLSVACFRGASAWVARGQAVCHEGGSMMPSCTALIAATVRLLVRSFFMAFFMW
jgi:hypothetical protein